MKTNGFEIILKSWDKLHYVNHDLIELLKSMLQQNQKYRATIQDIKKSPYFLNPSIKQKNKMTQSQ